MTDQSGHTRGRVAFVGTGPGDPGLLTLRAVSELARANIVILDRGVNRSMIRAHCNDRVVLVDAADSADPMIDHVARLAAEGNRVVWMISSGGASGVQMAAQIMSSRERHLPIEIIPGVSATAAVPLYAGVCLSGDVAGTVHVANPHLDPNYGDMVDPNSTALLNGSVSDLRRGISGLIDAGRDPNDAAILVLAGTTSSQRSVSGTLRQVAGALRRADDDGTHTVVVGPGVRQHQTGAWFESRALFGWQVLVPSTLQDIPALTARLEEYGATSDVVPTMLVEPPRTPRQLDRALRDLVNGQYEWIAFTSANAVSAIRTKLRACGLDARALAGLRIAATKGEAAAALHGWGIDPDLVARHSGTSQLAEDWPVFDRDSDPIDKVLVPRAETSTEVLSQHLTDLGWGVDEVVVARAVRANPPAPDVRHAIKQGKYDAVVFSSASCVRNLVGIAGKPHPVTVVACIGPATAEAALEYGLRVDAVADQATEVDLVDALAAFARRRSEQVDHVLPPPSQQRRRKRTAAFAPA